jgi:hypothetical protein
VMKREILFVDGQHECYVTNNAEGLTKKDIRVEGWLARLRCVTVLPILDSVATLHTTRRWHA